MTRSTTARFLWILLGLFCLRVVGQALVAYAGVRWLPPMPEWYSGLLPYHLLLPAQIAIVVLLTWICFDLSRGRGLFATPRRGLAGPVLWFGWLYLAVMIVRYPVRMYVHPEARWFGQTIPIFFHWVLATFVILYGRYQRDAISTTARSRDGIRPASRDHSGSRAPSGS